MDVLLNADTESTVHISEKQGERSFAQFKHTCAFATCTCDIVTAPKLASAHLVQIAVLMYPT